MKRFFHGGSPRIAILLSSLFAGAINRSNVPQSADTVSVASVSARMSEPIQFPFLPLTSLDTLWFQVSGTLCNLRCHHCFISCAPDNHTRGLMKFEQVKAYLDESVKYGVKEYYFTGGEPFINPDIFRILEATLAIGPATVLTNATRFTEEKVARLAALLGETGGDCLAVRSFGAESLVHPEPGYFTLGMKSYGRTPDFLIRTGLEQIASLLDWLAQKPA